MLRRILGSNTFINSTTLHKSFRIKELNAYLCLRESLNSQVAQQEALRFQKAIEVSQISNQAAFQIIKIFYSDLTGLQQYVSPEKAAQTLEKSQQELSKIGYYDVNKTLQENIDTLKRDYPRLWEFTILQGERLEALKSLEQIFIKDGPSLEALQNNSIIERYALSIETKLKEHLQNLQNIYVKDTTNNNNNMATIQNIQENFNQIINKLKEDPSATYGLILHYIDIHNSRLPSTYQLQSLQKYYSSIGTSTTQIIQPGTQADSQVDNAVNKLSKQLNQATNDIDQDLQVIAQEAETQLKDNIQLNFTQSENGKATIYDANAQIKPLLGLGLTTAAISGSWLYLLLQGTSTYTTLFTLPALALLCFRQLYVRQQNNSATYIRRIQVYQDGKTIDVYIEHNAMIHKIDNLPISEFKIIQGEQLIKEIQGDHQQPKIRVTPNYLRFTQFGQTSKFAIVGDKLCLLPLNYKGHSTSLQNLFAGKTINTIDLI